LKDLNQSEVKPDDDFSGSCVKPETNSEKKKKKKKKLLTEQEKGQFSL
jgi:hypothetical protein